MGPGNGRYHVFSRKNRLLLEVCLEVFTEENLDSLA